MTEELHRDLGRLEATVANLKEEVAGHGKLLSEIHSTITEARGSWRTLVGVAGAAGALAGAVTWMLAKVKGA